MANITNNSASAQAPVGHNASQQFDASALLLDAPIAAAHPPALTADDFDDDDDGWYVMQCAHELGMDCQALWHSVLVARHKRASRMAIAEQLRDNQTTVVGTAATPLNSMPWPPGRAGTIARFMHATSYLPIPEMAITATLALLAGVCGRAYRTHTGKDIALYMILVAKSGVGKDTIHEGIPRMLKLADQPMADYFLRAEDFASGEALHKTLLKSPGFLYLQGEFGRKLKRMANPTDAPMQTFRTVMTNAFAKQYLEGKTYARADDSLVGVEWPALSFLGETTPSTFLESLTSDMMQDGFLSRFLIATYQGGQPAPNKSRHASLNAADLQAWKDLVGHTTKYQTSVFVPDAIVTVPDAAAEVMLDNFEAHCRERLNATEDESERPVWTRAHIKAMKVACLLAVADHYLEPVVKSQHVEWAIALVQRDMEMFLSNQRDGNVGNGDDTRERKLLAIIRKYLELDALPAACKFPLQMQKDGIVPRSYLHTRVNHLATFTNHRQGANRALEETLANLCKSGVLHLVKKETLVSRYGSHANSYAVVQTLL